MKNFDVNSYLSFAEQKFSGADGSYDLGGVNELDLGFDASVVQRSIAAQAKTPSPYVLNITNSTSGTLNAVLFGYNRYSQAANYGSDVGVSVTNANIGVSYIQTISQLASQPVETSYVRLTSTNVAQITQPWELVSFDANGQSCNIPIITSTFFSPSQFQSGIMDVTQALKLDGNTSISFPVLASATITMAFFPSSKVNIAGQLNGRPSLQNYAMPNLAVAGTPVLISANRA